MTFTIQYILNTSDKLSFEFLSLKSDKSFGSSLMRNLKSSSTKFDLPWHIFYLNKNVGFLSVICLKFDQLLTFRHHWIYLYLYLFCFSICSFNVYLYSHIWGNVMSYRTKLEQNDCIMYFLILIPMNKYIYIYIYIYICYPPASFPCIAPIKLLLYERN